MFRTQTGLIMGGFIGRRIAAPLMALAVLGLGSAAQSAPVYTIQVTTNVDLGVITSAATGDTVFRVDPTSGSVTVVSGGATRSGSGTARALVTISCAATAVGDCTKTVNVRLGTVGSPTGRARALTRILYTMGTATLAGGPGLPGTTSFTIGAIGPNATKTFYVGADFGVAADDSNLATGAAESDFYAFAAEAPAAATGGDTGRFTARIIRSIAMTKTSDLVFGRISKPLSGLGTVTINAVTGARSVSGAQAFDSPAPTRATFSVTGEGGQAFTATVPATFVMSGPQALTVTTSSSAGGSPVLSSSLGSQGSYVLGVGGSVPINASTPEGDYSGSFTVTVAYN